MAAYISKISRWSALLCALLLVSGTLAACGGDDSSSSDSDSSSTPAQTSDASGGADAGGGVASSTLDIDATEAGGGEQLGFSRRTLTARAGSVTIRLANGAQDRLPHAISIEGNGVDRDGEVVQPGGTSTVTVDLRPGRYTFYCPVGDHEEDGMKGTLTVQ